MITAFLAAQSALALTLARARKRASVIRTMSLGGADSAPLRLLSRSLSSPHPTGQLAWSARWQGI